MGNITTNGVEWSSNNNNSNNVNTTIIIIVVIVVVIVIAVVVFLLAFAGGFLIGRNRDAEGRKIQESAFSRVTEESERLLMECVQKSLQEQEEDLPRWLCST